MDARWPDLYTCPACGGPATKAMYVGLPMKLCGDVKDCCHVWGLWAFVFDLGVPFNGWMIRYNSYWSCLWEFLTGESARKADE